MITNTLEKTLRTGKFSGDPELAEDRVNFARFAIRNGMIDENALASVERILEPETIVKEIGANLRDGAEDLRDRIKGYDKTYEGLGKITGIPPRMVQLYHLGRVHLKQIALLQFINSQIMDRGILGALTLSGDHGASEIKDLVKDELRDKFPQLYKEFSTYLAKEKQTYKMHFTLLFMDLFDAARRGTPLLYASSEYKETNRLYSTARHGFSTNRP